MFCGYSVIMTYLRVFQLGGIFFQAERIAGAFNFGEYGYFLASIDFVGTKSKRCIDMQVYIVVQIIIIAVERHTSCDFI